jgi:hypothetical protein
VFEASRQLHDHERDDQEGRKRCDDDARDCDAVVGKIEEFSQSGLVVARCFAHGSSFSIKAGF